MDQQDMYWCETGKFQSIANEIQKLVPEIGESDILHIELYRRMANIYYDFHNNGNDTWKSIVENGRADMYYMPPSDAPKSVQRFFQACERDCHAIEEIYYQARRQEMEEGDDYDYENDQYLVDSYRFDEHQLEQIMDDTILYVQAAISAN